MCLYYFSFITQDCCTPTTFHIHHWHHPRLLYTNNFLYSSLKKSTWDKSSIIHGDCVSKLSSQPFVHSHRHSTFCYLHPQNSSQVQAAAQICTFERTTDLHTVNKSVHKFILLWLCSQRMDYAYVQAWIWITRRKTEWMTECKMYIYLTLFYFILLCVDGNILYIWSFL